MTQLIDAHGLYKTYDGKTVLNKVDISVAAGCVTGFIGANGAGKTTTIRALLGLMPLDQGEVIVFGEPFGPDAGDACAKRIKERISVVFDTCPFIGDLPVKTAGTIMKTAYAEWSDTQFANYLNQFNLEPNKLIKELSRGMSMKLQLACALAHNPDLLILDEATAGLDPMARDEILDLLRQFMENENHGILISSHITTDLEKIADKIVCIEQGSIVFDVEKDQITDIAGIAHCRTSDAEAILSSGVYQPGSLRIVRNPLSIDILIPDRFRFAQRFPTIACDKASIDDYMQLMLKGEIR